MNDTQRATLYAVYKAIEKTLEEDGDLPPGFLANLNGHSLLVTLPDTRISRDAGLKGDGIIHKKATQSLYGYGTWALLFDRLKSFNQYHYIRNILKDVWTEAVKNKTKVQKELASIDPELDKFAKELQKQDGPKRAEETPRLASFNGVPMFCFDERRQLNAAA